MEKPTYTAIDYNSKENKVIEGLVRDNYSKVKNTFYKVFDKRSKNPNSPVGLCADLIKASRYKDDPDRILWRKVIKSWFTPQRFNLTYVYFGYSTPLIQHLKEEVLDINGRVWFKVPLEKLKDHEYLMGTAFWFPVSKNYNAERIKILECALEDLERIKREGEPELPPLTFEEPKNIPLIMVKVKVISDKPNKRILRCSEGNRVWYRLWINPEDMMRIEPLLEGGDRIWMEELEMYYTFFYEIRNGRRVLGKDRIKGILDILL